jgi:hypothetical protein
MRCTPSCCLFRLNARRCRAYIEGSPHPSRACWVLQAPAVLGQEMSAGPGAHLNFIVASVFPFARRSDGTGRPLPTA